MKKTTGFYPRPSVDTKTSTAVGQAGGVLLTATVRASGYGSLVCVLTAPDGRVFDGAGRDDYWALSRARKRAVAAGAL